MTRPAGEDDSRLDAADIPGVLVELGVVEDGEAVKSCVSLGGGVSSSVFQARLVGRSVVVKQALSKLRVAGEWWSDPSRSSVECRAARYLSSILPGHVPAVLAEDPARHLFVMDAAPGGSGTWKAEMLSGRFDPEIAAQAGSLLGRIHQTSSGDTRLAEEFADKRYFRELRLDAYILEVARLRRDLSSIAEAWATRLETGATCLVHGDFSPKNLLVRPGRGVQLIDHEVAHWGDPSFDVTFLATHLLAKSMRSSPALGLLSTGLAEYRRSAPAVWKLVDGSTQLLGLVMMARIIGKSPLEYLSVAERELFAKAALQFIHEPPPSLVDAPAVARRLLWAPEN